MPKVNGLTVLRTLRARGSAPAGAAADSPGRRGRPGRRTDAGADDYLIKPFALDELPSTAAGADPERKRQYQRLHLADLTVDTAARTASGATGRWSCPPGNTPLLEYLIRSKGVVLSRQRIEDNLWSLDYAGGTNVVDVYISYLRKKLELPGERKLLHTVRGMGWVLKEDA